MSQTVTGTTSVATHQTGFKSNRKAFIISLGATLVVLLFGAASLLLSNTSGRKQAADAATAYAVGSLSTQPISDLQSLNVGQADHLDINGRLRVTDTITVAPTAQPTNPEAGQIYYDKNTNQPYYYNGAAFVSLAPNGVTSLGSASGAITVGSGLQLANGQLGLSPATQALLNSARSASTGVASLQGQTGAVSLAAGSGISINGTTIVNSGVTSLVSSSSNVTISQGANGAYTLSGNVVGGTGATGQIALFTGGSTLSGSILSQSGSTVTVSGTLSVTGAVSANSLQQTAAGKNVTVNAGTDGISFVAGGITFTFPTTGGASQTICTTGISCAAGGGQAVVINPASPQADNGTGSSIAINKTGSGSLLQLQSNGTNVFVVNNSGTISVGSIDYSQVTNRPSSVVTSVTGTANQVIASSNTGNIVLSLPQDIAATSSPSFGSVSLGGNLSVAATSNFGGAVSINGNNTLTVGTGATVLGGNLSVTGVTNLSNSLNVAGATTLSSSLAIQGANALTLGRAGITSGSIAFANTTNTNYGVLQAAAPSGLGNASYLFPSVVGGTSDTVCLRSLNNCGGSPATVTTSTAGTTNRLAKFTGSNTIADSSLTDDGTTVTIAAILSAATISTATIQSSGTLSITPGGSLTIGAANQVTSIQGNASSTIAVSANGYTSSLAFTAPATGNQTITLPDATGTICLQNSATCGFATSGSGVTTITGTAAGSVGAAGAISLNDALTSGSAITINNASTTQKGIASFNPTNFSASSGNINTIQDINLTSSVQFGNLALGNGGNITLSSTGKINTNNITGLGGGDVTFDAVANAFVFKTTSGANSFVFPTSGGLGQVICTSGITCTTGGGQAVVLEPSAVQTASTNRTAIFINKAAGSGNLLQLQSAGTDALVIDASGNTSINNSTTIAGLSVTGSLVSNTITPTSALTIGATSQVFTLQGTGSSTISATGGGFTTNVGFNVGSGGSAPTGNVNYRFQNDNTVAPGSYNVCTTVGNCAGVGGGVTTAGGTANKLAKFTSAGSIADSIITDGGAGLVTIGGSLTVGISGSAALTLGISSTTSGSLVFNNATNSFTQTFTPSTTSTANTAIQLPNTSGTLAVGASGPIVLDALTGQITCPTCLTSGGGGTSGISTITGTAGGSAGASGAVTFNDALTTASAITINDASTTQKGIASFNAINFSASGGVINLTQDIATGSSPTFANLSLQGTTGLTLGSSSNIGQLAFRDGTVDGYKAAFTPATLTANRSITIPDSSGTVAVAGSGNIALSTSGVITTINNPSFTTSVTTPSLISSGALSITSGGQLSLGGTAQQFNLIGSTSSTIVASTGSFSTTVNFTPPTANRTISLPDATGTLCLQSSAACGFALSGNVVNSVNGLNGSLTIANATVAGLTITVNDASTTQKGIALFNATNFTVSSGAVNTIQDIATTATPSFAGETVGANGLSVNGATTFNGSTAISGSNTFTVGSGITTLGGALNVAGATNFSSAVAIANNLSVSNGPGIVATFSGRVAGGNAVNNDEFTTLGQITTLGSGAYIANGTALQSSANFNIQALTNGTTGTIGGIIRGAAGGQTADLFQFQDTSGTVIGSVSAAGALTAVKGTFNGDITSTGTINLSGSSTNNLTGGLLLGGIGEGIFSNRSGSGNDQFGVSIATGTAKRLSVTQGGLVGINTSTFGAQLQTNASTSATVGQIIQGAFGQTADLLQLTDSTGAVLSRYDASGNIVVGGTGSSSFAGSLGIGTISPAYKLDVQGGTGIVAQFSGRVIGNNAVNSNEFATLSQVTGAVGGISGNFVQNGTTQQSANFNIVSATSSSIAAVIQGATSQSVDVLRVGTAGNPSALSVNSVGNTVIGAGSSLVVTGSTAFPSSPSEGQIYYGTDTKQLYVYANGKWQADRSSATIIVAASNTLNKEKADYVGDGTNDQNAINAAIAALPATGGSVVLLDGTFNVAGTIAINKPSVKLIGQGDSTNLNRKFDNGSLIYLTNNDEVVASLAITGNQVTYTSASNHAIWLDGFNVGMLRVDSVYINGTSGSGVYISTTPVTGTSASTVINSRIYNVGSHGIYLGGSQNSFVSGNYVYGSGVDGVGAIGSNLNITNNQLIANATGINLGAYADAATVTNNNITDSVNDGIYLDKNNLTITNNHIWNSGGYAIRTPSATNTNIISGNNFSGNVGGLALNGISYYQISNNVFKNTSNSSVYLFGSSSYNSISSNKISGSGGSGTSSALNMNISSGSDNKIFDNEVSAMSGTGTAMFIASTATNTYLSGNSYSGYLLSDNSNSTIYANQQDSTGNINLHGQAGVGINTLTPTTSLQNAGGFSNIALPTPGAPTVTNFGTAGSTSYTYAVTAYDGLGETLPSTGTVTMTGSATLDSTNYNQITPARVGGAVSYRVYRTASSGLPSSTGLIGSVAGGASNFYLNDTGLAATTAVPVLNSTGGGSVTGNFGLGTMSAAYKLDVQGGTGIVAQFSGRVIGANAINTNEFATLSQVTGAVSGASGNYIANSTSQQTANFNIQSAAATSVAAVIGGTVSQTADILQINNGAGVKLLSVNPGGTVFLSPFTGQTYRPFIVSDSTNKIFDVGVNLNSYDTNNTADAGYLIRQGQGAISFYTRAPGATLPVNQLSISNGGGATFSTYLSVRNVNNLALVISDSGGTYQQLRVQNYSTSIGQIPNSVTSGPGNLSVYGSGGSTVGQVILGGSGQTADLLQLQNSAGTVLSRFDSNGSFIINLPAPTTPGISTASTGGSLTAATYYYKITALDKAGNETTASPEVNITTAGATSTVTVSGFLVNGASSYRIYQGTTAGAENVYFTRADTSNNPSFTDTGSASTVGSPPATNTAKFSNLQSTSSALIGGSASGQGAFAAGMGSISSNFSSVALGNGATGSGFRATAIGTGNTASGLDSVAFGANSTASGSYAFTLAGSSTAAADRSIAIGTGINIAANAGYAIGLGLVSNVNTERALTFGNNSSGGASVLYVRGGLYAGPGGTVSTTSGSAIVTGVGTIFTNTFIVGDSITIGAETYSIISIASNTSMTVATNYTTTNSAVSYTLDAAIFKLQDAGGTPQLFVNYAGDLGLGTTNPGARLQINTRNAASIGQIIQGVASQTADLLQFQNSSGTVLAKVSSAGDVITSGGRLTAERSNQPTQYTFISQDSGGGHLTTPGQTLNIDAYNLSINTPTNIYGTPTVAALTAHQGSSGSTTPGLVVAGGASATGDLFQLQSNTGTLLSKFTSTGQLVLGTVATAGTVQAGSLGFSDGTIDGYTATVGTSSALLGNTSFNLPGGLAAGAYTLCTSSNNCSSAPASGSTGYIQNGTTTQTANFNIQSAAAASIGAVIKGTVSQTADLLQLQNSAGSVVSNFDANGNLGQGNGASLFNNVAGLSAGGARVEENTTNLISNPSFETNATGWANTISTTSSRVSSGAGIVVGQSALEATIPTSNQNGVQYLVSGGLANTLYTASLYVTLISGDPSSLGMHLHGTAGTCGDNIFPNLTAGQTVRVSVTATCGAGVLTTLNFWRNSSAAISTAVVRIDAVQVEQKSYATSYTDGSMGSGYAWTGTANASTSTRTAGGFVADGSLTSISGGLNLQGVVTSNGLGNSYLAGNLGIGTTAPSQKLDVQGGNINTSGSILTGGTTRLDASGNLSNIGTIAATGAVTAGTYNGQTISSAANFTGTLAVAGATTLSSTLAVQGAGNSSFLGNLGVGTTTPSAKLNIYNGNTQIDYGNLNLNQQAAPTTAPTLAVNITAGNITGNHYYVVSYVTNQGETSYGPVSALVAPSAQQVNLSAIPTGTANVVTQRKIYRTTTGGTTSGPFYLVTTIADNITTTYTDNLSDASLGAAATNINRAGGLITQGNSSILTSSGNNLAVGTGALQGNSTGIYNTATGYNSLYSNTTGGDNTAIGSYALYSNTTGEGNAASGEGALTSNTTGNENTASGLFALNSNTTGNYNVASGDYALFSNTTGAQNTASGGYALYSNTTGINNDVSGTNALVNSTTGSNNAASGYAALRYLVTLTGTISATASNAGNAQFTTGYTSGLVAGASIIITGTTSYNGTRTVLSVDSTTKFTISTAFSTADTTGSWTTASPDNNTALGYQAGIGSTNFYSAVGGTYVGYNTGFNLQTGANYNTLLGYSAGSNLTTGSNNIIIGQNAQAASATGSNQLNIGGLLSGDLLAGTLSVGGTTTIISSSTSAFKVQDAGGLAALTVDSTNKVVTVGNGANTITLSSTTGFTATGTARKTKKISLTAEYAGAVLDAGSGANNTGTMTSGVNLASRMNYYKWTTTQATNQNYDVVIQVPIPADFDGFASGTPINVSTYSSDLTNGTLSFELRDSTNTVTQNFVSVTPSATGSFQVVNTGTVTGTYTAGDYLMVRIRMQSPTAGDVRVGNITMDYLSKF